MKIGVLISRVRVEEKLILNAASRRGVEVDRIHDRDLVFDLERPDFPRVDIVLDRGLIHSRAEYTLRLLESWGCPSSTAITPPGCATTSFSQTWR
ncbi:MAG: hypothetical protein WKH64_06640 [Chloroflexia bacterium]